MKTPEQALAAARVAAAERRAEGGYQRIDEGALAPSEARPSLERLLEWALIDPDLREVRSTRRAGRPITALKHGLLRLLGQYHGLLIADQTRFNVNLLVYVRRLESRIEELEQRQSER